jgi:alpha-1,2-mannosyltransferase
MTELGSVDARAGRRPDVQARVRWLMSVALFGLLPAVTIVILFVTTIQDDAVAFDFRVFYDAAEAVLAGESPYQSLDDESALVARGYVYPPLTALVVIPITILPPIVAGLLVMALLTLAALAVPYAVGVRDWRCYGLLLLWPPVLSAIQTGSITVLLALSAALAWRWRDRTVAPALAVGATLAAKLILWPLILWLAASRRLLAAVLGSAIAAALVLGSWAAIGFAGLLRYSELLSRLNEAVGADAYTLYIVGLDLGLPSAAARALWLAVGLGLLAAVVVVGRRGDERSAFVLSIAAALALSPIVWLHYFALLLVVVSLARPTLGLMWFVPLGMVVTPGSGSPTPFETAATLIVASLTLALALRATLGSRDPARAARPTGMEPALS